MSEENNSPWMEAAAIIIAGVVVSAGIMLVIAVLFMGTSWALRQFGFHVSWEQFMAGMFLLLVSRIALSYLFHRSK